MKAIRNDEKNLTFVVLDDKAAMLVEIKAAGVKMGPTSLEELLSGKRANVVGFKLIDVPQEELDGASKDTSADQGGAAAGADQGGDQNRREGDGDNKGDQGGDNGGQKQDGQGFQNMDPEKQKEVASKGGQHSHDNDNTPEKRDPAPVPGNQGGTSEQHAAAGAQSHKGDQGGEGNVGDGNKENAGSQDSGGQQGADTQGQQGGGDQGEHPMRRSTDKPEDKPADDKPADDKPQAADGGDNKPAAPAPAPANTRKAFKTVQPKGKIKPVRSGTKIAKGLELLLQGTTQKELEETDGGVSDDVFDFVNRRVTKRGYGVKVDGDKISLIMPENVTKIAYSNQAEGTAEEQAPAKKPIDEVKKDIDGQGADGKSTPAPDEPAPAADKPADPAPEGDQPAPAAGDEAKVSQE